MLDLWFGDRVAGLDFLKNGDAVNRQLQILWWGKKGQGVVGSVQR